MIRIVITIVCLMAPILSQAQMEPLKLGQIRPSGWLRNQMVRDITSGYISCDHFWHPPGRANAFSDKKTLNYKVDSLGRRHVNESSWGWGENDGYYTDVVVRNAFLTGYEPWMNKAKEEVDRIMKYQDRDGYIGIYERGNRLSQQEGENGDLWTQSRALMGLLAYHEFTGDKKCLAAVEKAVAHTMEEYQRSGHSPYRHVDKPGVAHGLMYVEPLEWLWRITGDEKYYAFAQWLYDDYCQREDSLGYYDIKLDRLLRRNSRFEEHAAHVVEHMRVPLWLAHVNRREDYVRAVDNMFFKLDKTIAPSGAIVTDPNIYESVAGNYGSGDLPYEYCTITELLITYASALRYTGLAEYGDHAERLVFNAGQGARLPDGKAMSYLTTDNRLSADESVNFRFPITARHWISCCNLNAAKLMPYYIANMWMRSGEDALAATLYGSCEVAAEVAGKHVRIVERTMYPFEGRIEMEIEPERPVRFTLMLRRPVWASHAVVEAKGATIEPGGDGFIRITKVWEKGDKAVVDWGMEVLPDRSIRGDLYLMHGPLLYAMRLEEKLTPIKELGNGFANWAAAPADPGKADKVFGEYRISGNADIFIRMPEYRHLYRYEKNPQANTEYPFDTPYGYIKGRFVDNGNLFEGTLVPMGSTVLRKVTFTEHNR